MPLIERTIALKKGDSIELRFKGSAAGGYEWTTGIINEGLIQVEKSFAIGTTAQGLPSGSSAEEVYKINAVEKGTAVIHFMQKRMWEEDTPPRKEEKVTLEIT